MMRGRKNIKLCAMLTSVACPTRQYCATLCHKRHDIREEKVIERKIRVLRFSTTLSETCLIMRRIERDIIKKCLVVFMQSTRYSCQIVMKLEFSRQIFEE